MSKLAKIEKPVGFELEMFKVDYIDFDMEYSDQYIRYELLPFKNKRKEFEHEQEFRIMIYQNNPYSQPFGDKKLDFFNPMKAHEIVRHGFVSRLNDLPAEGIKININASELIDEIIASPNMEEYEVVEIQRILDLVNKHEGTCYTIRRSKLYESLQY